MRHALASHPDFPTDAVRAIEVDVARPSPDALSLVYRVSGRIGALRIPARSRPVRTDELWRTTCFEAFLRPEPGEAYVEFNFAPSRRWAAYGFTGPRADMAALAVAPPRIRFRAADDVAELHVALELPVAARGRLALAAVIEAADGRISYWSLAHPSGRPDFHHAAGFAAALPSPLR
jgi:hypothetical protein